MQQQDNHEYPFLLSAADLPPSPTKSSNLSETAEVPACNVPSRSPLPALAIAPETKLGTASSGLGTLASTMKSRRGFAIQRLMNAMRQAHADGWFIVFDTLTLADDRLEAFYDNPNALRDYFRDIGRMVLAAEGRKANDSHADCYQYFCVPEYGT